MHVWMDKCIDGLMDVCVDGWVINVCMYGCMCVCVGECMYGWMYVCLGGLMHGRVNG